MPTFTRKTFASYYKNLFGINQSGNTGIDNTSRNVQDGDGKNTSISLSKNHLNVKPENTNSSTTFNVKTLSGASLLTVDTSNISAYIFRISSPDHLVNAYGLR